MAGAKAERWIADLADVSAKLEPEVQADLFRFQRESRRYKACLPHDLAQEAVLMIKDARSR